MDSPNKFCSRCGGALQMVSLTGDDVVRPWCEVCACAQYQNPTIMVAVFLYCGAKLFWTQRGIEPAKGGWAVPAGYMECGESLQEAAARELFEETSIKVRPEKLIPMSISSVLAVDQVYMVFRTSCDTEIESDITAETSDWGWYSRAQAPWQSMAHPGSKGLVEEVYTAIESGKFFMRIGQMSASGNYHSRYDLV